MAAYLIYDVDIHDPERYFGFMQQMRPIVESFGGRYLVRGGDHETLEGDWHPTKLVVIRFPDMSSARKLFTAEEYEPLRDIRRASSTGDVVLVEGA